MVYKALYDPVPLALFFFYSPYSLQGFPGSKISQIKKKIFLRNLP